MINKHDAPEGYIAVKAESIANCSGCVFDSSSVCLLNTNCKCYPAERKDGESVIFIPDPDKQVNKETEQVMQDIVNGDNVEQLDAETLLKDFDNKLVELAKIRNKIEQVLGKG